MTSPVDVTALDEIAFLGLSENRIDILDVLTDEQPHTRDELMETTNVSRPTLARILDELETRTWITQRGQTCKITPLGSWVYEEFIDIVETMEAEQQLREALRWFPSDLLTFDIRCLCDAEIILMTESGINALLRRIDTFHRNGEYSRGFAIQVTPPLIDTLWEASVHGETRIDWVVTPEFIDGIQIKSTAEERFNEILDQEQVDFSVYEDIPLSVGIVDGEVGITLTDDHDIVRGGLATENSIVHEWAVNLFETYREQAEPIDGPLGQATSDKFAT